MGSRLKVLGTKYLGKLKRVLKQAPLLSEGLMKPVALRKNQEKPPWLKQRLSAEGVAAVSSLMHEFGLNTVCQSADCPNIGECFGARIATFLILGGICTRNCKFCAVKKGRPKELDFSEPERVAQAVRKLGLKHTVITSVTRDDLLDGGAGLFAACINKVRELNPGTTVEVLVPDFRGDYDALATVLEARPEVFNHNIETVPRLYDVVRPQANYRRSLSVLQNAADYGAGMTKSGLMVGLGESVNEVLMVLKDLVANGVQAVTIGQYLQPSPDHLEVVEYIQPELFKSYEVMGYDLGFFQVQSGPLVRSSYHAATILNNNL